MSIYGWILLTTSWSIVITTTAICISKLLKAPNNSSIVKNGNGNKKVGNQTKNQQQT
ncbi:MAG: hypothetical protein N2254_06405 [bacterium]|nr:hypothetical protein [bacterium]MDW8086859.1 hypothetical protein [Candidatus Calescibacterium sp.]